MAAVGVLAVTSMSTMVAGAEPTPAPSNPDQRLAAALAGMSTTQDKISAIEVQLANDQAALDKADIDSQIAAENYNQAMVDLDTATAAAKDANDRADVAQGKYEEARKDLTTLALSAYRNGSASTQAIQAFLTPGGIDDVVTRANLIDSLGSRADTILQKVDAAQLVAKAYRDQANAAQEKQQAATDAVKATSDTAQASADAASQKLSDTQGMKDAAVSQLAAFRNTTVQIEQERLAQQQADQIARENAAAEAERIRNQPAPPPSTAPVAPTQPTQPTTAPTVAPTRPPTQPTTPPVAPPVVPTPAPTTDPVPPSGGGGSGTASAGQKAVDWARLQLGKGYLWGASGPDKFDCSGLTSQAWLKGAGVAISRTSRSQYAGAQKISYDDMRPGDLIFWATDTSNPSTIYHVAIYVGNGKQIDAPNPSTTVREIPIRWASTMPYAGRV